MTARYRQHDWKQLGARWRDQTSRFLTQALEDRRHARKASRPPRGDAWPRDRRAAEERTSIISMREVLHRARQWCFGWPAESDRPCGKSAVQKLAIQLGRKLR
jgi:hypothetical protein